MASIGMGSGLANPYLQADRLVQQQPASQYDPSQYINPQLLAQQAFANQGQYLSQSFNQQNPRMALPQNVGAALGAGVSQFASGMHAAMSPSQSGNPQQGTPQDPSQGIQQEFYKRLSTQLQAQIAQGGTPNYGKAQYLAATSLMTDPTYTQSPVAQSIAAKYVTDAKEKGYTPETDAATQASVAQKNEAVTDAQDKDTQTKLLVQQARDKQQYVPVKWTKDSTGAMYPQQTGAYIPAFIDNAGTVDPDLEVKKNAAVHAAGGAQAGAAIMPLEDFNANKAAQAEMARQTALQKAQFAETARQDAVNNVNKDVANNNGIRLVHGDMTIQDLSGSGPNANAMRQASIDAADKFAAANNTTWSPTDVANRKKAESSWMSGSDHQTFQKAATVPRHLDDLEQIASTLDSGSFVPGNEMYQKAARMVGVDPGTKVPSFDLAKQVFSLELSGALNQRGGSTEDRVALTNQIKAADSPQTLSNTLHTEEKLWADKFADMKSSYETNVSGKRFFGDLVNPQQQQEATTMYSKYYPISVGAGDAEKYYFDKLPAGATVQTPAGRVMTAGQLRALYQAGGGK